MTNNETITNSVCYIFAHLALAKIPFRIDYDVDHGTQQSTGWSFSIGGRSMSSFEASMEQAAIKGFVKFLKCANNN